MNIILNNVTTFFSILIILGIGIYLILEMKKMAQNNREIMNGKLSVNKYPELVLFLMTISF